MEVDDEWKHFLINSNLDDIKNDEIQNNNFNNNNNNK